jgi:hypothetical protein
MGNQIAADLIEALRLSALGSTLSSRSVSRPPAFVEISSFPGVAKAVVKFFGDYSTPNTPCQLVRTYNVKAVTFLSRGQYRVELNNSFADFNLGTDYSIVGSVEAHSLFLTAANSFYIQNDATGLSNSITLTSFRIFTTNTTTSGISAANARYVSLTIF